MSESVARHHAILVAPGEYPKMDSLQQRLPAELHLVGDRSWLQRQLETCVDGGVHKIEVVLCNLPQKTQESLGNGERWGCKIEYTLAQDPNLPCRALRARSQFPDWLWFLHGQWLLQQPLPLAEEGTPQLLVTEDGQWAGAAWIPGETVRELVNTPHSEVGAKLMELIEGGRSTVKALQLSTTHSLLVANQYFLQSADWPRAGRESEPGLWIGRDVALHPTVELIQPVYIAAHCRVGYGVKLGPNVVIGNNVVIDSATSVSESVVFSGCYLGSGLDISNSLVDHQRLILAESDFEVHVSDPVILSSVVQSRDIFLNLSSRVWAVILLVIFFPIWLLQRALGGQLTSENQAVRQPCVADPDQWVKQSMPFRVGSCASRKSHFWQVFLPGLTSAAAGKIQLAGMPVRTSDDLRQLGPDHLQQVVQLPVGLVSETLVQFGCQPTSDQTSVSDSYYAATRSTLNDVKLVWRYLLKVLTPEPRY